MLASRFASHSPALRSDHPLSDDQIRRVAPSIFAEAPHQSRSERYSYIPTAAVLTELRKEGFQPFMVCQTRVRRDDRRDFTKHLLRLRHASQINGAEANEIILLNSHDGTSSYQMLAGQFRFVCSNGLVCGDTVADVRVPHKGDVAGLVILSPAVWVKVLGNASAIFPYDYPAIVSMNVAFFFTWLGSVTDRSTRGVFERDGFDDQFIRAQTGIGASGAVSH